MSQSRPEKYCTLRLKDCLSGKWTLSVIPDFNSTPHTFICAVLAECAMTNLRGWLALYCFEYLELLTFNQSFRTHDVALRAKAHASPPEVSHGPTIITLLTERGCDSSLHKNFTPPAAIGDFRIKLVPNSTELSRIISNIISPSPIHLHECCVDL
jgi:hypothetical protein